MSIRIYGIAASRAIRPLWTATELGLDFEHVNMPYVGGATRTPEFLAINPNGHIPAVVDVRPEGEVVVWESMACALYLARVHGRADGVDISPANAQEEGQALRWSFWTMTEIERDALTVLMHRMAMPAEQRKPELANAAEGRLKAPLRVLEQALQRQHAQGQAHLGADRFTVTDVCVASVLNWVRPAESLMQAYPAVREWLHQCVNRTAHHSARKLGR